jgi:hypothetical protein
MGKIDAEGLPAPEQIYLASSLRAARQVESVLDARGVNYVVQVEELGRTALFGTMRHAAAFYVTAGQALYCREALAEAGLVHGIVDEGPVDEHLRDPSAE